jgi:hypothetical protein
MPGPIYAVSISSAESSGVSAKDFFEVDASTTERLILREVFFAAHASSQGSTQFLPVHIFRNSTAACAGGTTASILKRDARNRAANSAATVNASSPSTGGDMVRSFAWNTREPFLYRPDPEERPVTGLGERLNVRVGVSVGTTFSWSGHIIYEEAGTPATG